MHTFIPLLDLTYCRSGISYLYYWSCLRACSLQETGLLFEQ